MDLIKSRRTILVKDYNGGSLSDKQVDLLLEAANWAPTHLRTEPWRFVIFKGRSSVLDYVDFLQDWYRDHEDSVTLTDTARGKLDAAYRDWPNLVSHIIVILMKRDEEKLPEWEELSAVAMAVQNMHLLTVSMPDVAAFWSSHTFCKHARDSPEMKSFLNVADDEKGPIKHLGAFLVGKIDPKKRASIKSARYDINDKVTWRISSE